MDVGEANKFINALVKNLQVLCHGHVNFNSSIQVIGHLYLNVDSDTNIDYIVNEKVCKSDLSSTVFVSKSYHSEPKTPVKPAQSGKRPENTKHTVVPVSIPSLSQPISNRRTVPKRKMSQNIHPAYRDDEPTFESPAKIPMLSLDEFKARITSTPIQPKPKAEEEVNLSIVKQEPGIEKEDLQSSDHSNVPGPSFEHLSDDFNQNDQIYSNQFNQTKTPVPVALHDNDSNMDTVFSHSLDTGTSGSMASPSHFGSIDGSSIDNNLKTKKPRTRVQISAARRSKKYRDKFRDDPEFRKRESERKKNYIKKIREEDDPQKLLELREKNRIRQANYRLKKRIKIWKERTKKQIASALRSRRYRERKRARLEGRVYEEKVTPKKEMKDKSAKKEKSDPNQEVKETSKEKDQSKYVENDAGSKSSKVAVKVTSSIQNVRPNSSQENEASPFSSSMSQVKDSSIETTPSRSKEKIDLTQFSKTEGKDSPRDNTISEPKGKRNSRQISPRLGKKSPVKNIPSPISDVDSVSPETQVQLMKDATLYSISTLENAQSQPKDNTGLNESATHNEMIDLFSIIEEFDPQEEIISAPSSSFMTEMEKDNPIPKDEKDPTPSTEIEKSSTENNQTEPVEKNNPFPSAKKIRIKIIAETVEDTTVKPGKMKTELEEAQDIIRAKNRLQQQLIEKRKNKKN
ncbi:hypothetical protein LOTGIDRAFT_233838 [Lottia gigantea]|uniref:Uncharacterized protein n=1 Tax=Lottia gigantea TaxID=225164 RepID=V4A127_LOTGI|nr:hypothetical protein LOTGIDRAFT_233838 [Lottia gigantea]ESO90342.1 hypothetical protein LOTGIDRAFT_233838 [Lottia gigantea]